MKFNNQNIKSIIATAVIISLISILIRNMKSDTNEITPISLHIENVCTVFIPSKNIVEDSLSFTHNNQEYYYHTYRSITQDNTGSVTSYFALPLNIPKGYTNLEHIKSLLEMEYKTEVKSNLITDTIIGNNVGFFYKKNDDLYTETFITYKSNIFIMHSVIFSQSNTTINSINKSTFLNSIKK